MSRWCALGLVSDFFARGRSHPPFAGYNTIPRTPFAPTSKHTGSGGRRRGRVEGEESAKVERESAAARRRRNYGPPQAGCRTKPRRPRPAARPCPSRSCGSCFCDEVRDEGREGGRAAINFNYLGIDFCASNLIAPLNFLLFCRRPSRGGTDSAHTRLLTVTSGEGAPR